MASTWTHQRRIHPLQRSEGEARPAGTGNYQRAAPHILMAIKLGEEVRDVITGFKGIAYCRLTFLVGPDKIGVQPLARDNGYDDWVALDEDRLIATSIRELQELKQGTAE